MAPTAGLCCVSLLLLLLFLIGTIGALSVNRPTGRWARNEQYDDGWRASTGPFDPVREPSARHKTTAQDETLSFPPSSEPALSMLPTTAAETGATAEGRGGFYELVVGRKSSLVDSSHQTAVVAASGSPDVIIGRVMPGDGGDISTAAAVGGHSYYNSEIDRSLEDTTDSSTLSQQQFSKKSDLLLPPGSFYLPAVSRHSGEYYSQSEEAIYIPLNRRPVQHQEQFPITTRVVLVNNKSSRNQPSVYDKEDENDGETEDDDDSATSSEQISIDPGRRPPISPASDLVMTLYPNKILPQSQLRSPGVRSASRPNNSNWTAIVPGSVGSSSVIHEVKVVTPPHGYLPSNQAKTKQTSGNQQQRPQRPASKPNLLKPTTGQSSNVKTTGKTQLKGINFQPFTPEDISPLNYLNSAQLSAAFRAAVPQTIQDQVVAPSFAVFQQATVGAPNFPSPKAMDFTWNVSDAVFVPRPAATRQLSPPGANSFNSTAQLVSNQQKPIPVQQLQQQQQLLVQLKDDDSPREVVVRTKFSAANLDRPGSSSFIINNKNNNSSSSLDSSVEIVTGYFEDLEVGDTKSSAQYDIVPQLVLGRHQETVAVPQNHLQPQEEDGASGADAVTNVVQTKEPIPIEAAIPIEPSSQPPPVLHGDFHPMVNAESVLASNQTDVPSSSVLQITEKDAMLFVKKGDNSGDLVPVTSTSKPIQQPDHKFFIEEQHQVAESQVHQTSAREESPPQVQTISHKSSKQQGPLAPSYYYYKAGKISPKGAVYSVVEGHSKVKFFGFNALHLGGDDGSDGELLKQPDGKYPLFYSNHQAADHFSLPGGWSPYSPIASSPPPTPTFKVVPKKSIPIGSKNKSSIRPVYFAKRPASTDELEASSNNGTISDPFEYHQHLQKMASEDQRLPTSSPS